MTHQDYRPCELERLAAYVDGELPDADRAALDQHLEACPSCRSQLELQGKLKHAVAGLEGRSTPPESVLARIETLALRHRAQRGSPRLWASAGAVAAALLLALGTWASLSSGPSSLTDDLVADHLESVPPERPPEVASSEPRTVRRFFEGRVPFQPVTPHLPGSKLLGGRLCVIRGHTMQLLFYQHDQRTLSLFVSNNAERSGSGCETSLGHSVCRRPGGGVTLMLVGKLPDEHLDQLLRQATL